MNKEQFKKDMAEFKQHKKSVDLMAKANCGNETFADLMIDHLARSLGAVYGCDKFMRELCK